MIYTDVASAEHIIATTDKSIVHVAANISSRVRYSSEWYVIERFGPRDGMEISIFIHERRNAEAVAYLNALPGRGISERES